MRTLVWLRWPTTGAAPFAESGAEYDEMIADLVASGVITDPGMVYFDVRPSARLPTLELRVCDSCPSVDTIVLDRGPVSGAGQPRTRAAAGRRTGAARLPDTDSGGAVAGRALGSRG